MRTATVSYEVYKYNELTDEAKEVVKIIADMYKDGVDISKIEWAAH